MENLAKNAFFNFRSICWKFFKQTPLLFSEISQNILFLALLSKMIIPKLFVLKVDSCIKVVALIKIMTVHLDAQNSQDRAEKNMSLQISWLLRTLDDLLPEVPTEFNRRWKNEKVFLVPWLWKS